MLMPYYLRSSGTAISAVTMFRGWKIRISRLDSQYGDRFSSSTVSYMPNVAKRARVYIYLHTHIYIDIYTHIYAYIRGPGSSVGIATDFGLDGLGSNPGGDEHSRPSTPVLGPTQPPVQWVPGLSRG